MSSTFLLYPVQAASGRVLREDGGLNWGFFGEKRVLVVCKREGVLGEIRLHSRRLVSDQLTLATGLGDSLTGRSGGVVGTGETLFRGKEIVRLGGLAHGQRLDTVLLFLFIVGSKALEVDEAVLVVRTDNRHRHGSPLAGLLGRRDSINAINAVVVGRFCGGQGFAY